MPPPTAAYGAMPDMIFATVLHHTATVLIQPDSGTAFPIGLTARAHKPHREMNNHPLAGSPPWRRRPLLGPQTLLRDEVVFALTSKKRYLKCLIQDTATHFLALAPQELVRMCVARVVPMLPPLEKVGVFVHGLLETSSCDRCGCAEWVRVQVVRLVYEMCIVSIKRFMCSSRVTRMEESRKGSEDKVPRN